MMARVDYSRVTIALTEIKKRLAALEESQVKTTEGIMKRVVALEEDRRE